MKKPVIRREILLNSLTYQPAKLQTYFQGKPSCAWGAPRSMKIGFLSGVPA